MKLAHEEWLAAVQFLWLAGQISDDKRNEFPLLSDILGVTSLVDLLNAIPGATVGSVPGPFYAGDSPEAPFGADLVKDNKGRAVLLTGVVRAPGHRPIVTELFFDHDSLADSDAVFGVREPLVRHVEEAREVGLKLERRPELRIDDDFTLAE